MMIRPAGPHDREAITALHLSSMQRTYAPYLPPRYLMELAPPQRRDLWVERFKPAVRDRYVIHVAFDQTILAGFVCISLQPDDPWGNLIDNLHIDQAYQRKGLGRRLLSSGISSLSSDKAHRPLHLVVYEENASARSLYDSLEGQIVEKVERELEPGRIHFMLRYQWQDPKILLGKLGR